MPTLYVIEPGARIEKEYQRILVTKDDEVLMSIPLAHIDEVVLVGNVGATTQAMHSLLSAGASLSLLARSGRLLGRLRSPRAHNLPLRHKQYARGEDKGFQLELGKSMVAGKLANCRTLAMRMLRGKTQSGAEMARQLARLTAAGLKVAEAETLPALRGLEGSGARAYFSILRHEMNWPGLPFIKRTRRPPSDPVNALLSLGYSFLSNALIGACEVVGLDPYDGFFHSDKYGRPGLALDLMEEFRPLIVDSLALSLINKRILQPKHFFSEGEAFFLTRPGMRRFVKQYSRRLNTSIFHPLAQRSLSYQKCFEVQARQLRYCIEGKVDKYIPMRTR